MGTIIPLRAPGSKNQVSTPELDSFLPSIRSPEDQDGSMATSPASSSRIQRFHEELLQVMDESYLKNHCSVTVSQDLNLEDHNDGEIIPETDCLEELIVFSLEIQQQGSAKSDAGNERAGNREWGDVFLKIGDDYPFLFTMYTSDYVREQFDVHGEKIMPSSRDIILKARELGPGEIMRAVIKWVNLYAPRLMGKPISLEDDAILQTLVCDPGIEISCPTP